jgi:hypothetical protein
VRRSQIATLITALVLLAPAWPATATEPCLDPDAADYVSHACKVARLRERPFVVIGVVDSGVNPYHVDFRLPPGDDRIDVHPSEFIEGFPSSAPTLDLSFDSPTPAVGYSRDAAEWSKVTPNVPAVVAGTNIVGVLAGQNCDVCPFASEPDFFDTFGHGTGTASVTGGLTYGHAGPNVVLVPISDGGHGWRWAANQPWIDLISISWAQFVSFADESAEASHEAAASGKISCAASGNFTIPLVFWESQGPASTVHTGAVDPTSREIMDYSGSPVDVLGLTDQPAATYNSIEGEESFGGTSAATPHVCALIGRALSQARERLGDFREGPHGGGLAVGAPGSGSLSDGILTRLELEDAIEATAVPVSSEPDHFVRGGYGLVEAETIVAALEVVFGERPRPPRTSEDTWQMAIDAGRDALWDFFPDCRPTPFC